MVWIPIIVPLQGSIIAFKHVFEKLERYIRTSEGGFQSLQLLCKMDLMTSVLSNECQILVVLTFGGILHMCVLLHVDDIVTLVGARKLFTAWTEFG